MRHQSIRTADYGACGQPDLSAGSCRKPVRSVIAGGSGNCRRRRFRAQFLHFRNLLLSWRALKLQLCCRNILCYVVGCSAIRAAVFVVKIPFPLKRSRTTMEANSPGGSSVERRAGTSNLLNDPLLQTKQKAHLCSKAHSDYLRYEPDGVCVHYKGRGNHSLDHGVARALKAFRCCGRELHYFEVKILSSGGGRCVHAYVVVCVTLSCTRCHSLFALEICC